jgi:multicomponent Na+:H+ antiporter subunit B
LIYNGHNTPGGGFQGGTVLVGIFISRYLINTEFPEDLDKLRVIERIIFMLIILLITTVGIYQVIPRTEFYRTLYLMTINFLIGIKVFVGLTVIFIKFIKTDDRTDERN